MPKKTAQKSAWKRPKHGWSKDVSSSNKNTSSKIKLAFLALGIIILLLIIGKIVSVIKSFGQPIYTDATVSRTHVWNKKSNINLVIKTDSVSLLSFNPNEKKVIIVDMPASLYLNVPNGFGDWKLESIYELGDSEKPKIGGKLLKQSVAGFLGIPVDGYIVFDNYYQQQKTQDVLNNLRDGLWNGVSMLSSLETDLTPKELLSLNLGLSGVRFDKIENYDLSELKLLDETKLLDGEIVFTSDPVKMDSFSQKFSEDSVLSEKLSVAVFNATDVPGLAQKAARIISNLGGNVIISANASIKQQKSLVVIKVDSESGLDNKVTPRVLGQFFTSDCSGGLKCDIIICEVQANRELSERSPADKCKIDDPQVLESRAQVNVVLGEDFDNRF